MTEANPHAVEIEGISKRFGRVLALDGVSLAIRDGEMFALLGPNGAGKSTLMLIVATLLEPDSGTVRVSGIDARKQPRRARRELGVVFQESSLDTRLTVEENLDFHGRVFGVPADLRRRRIAELLEIVELDGMRDRLVRTLSAGMRRRIEIARSLVHDSRVLMLDEPTVGLDAQSRARIWEYLQELRRLRGVTVIVSSHYIEEVEACERVCIIDHGRVLALDTPGALRDRFGEQSIRLETRDARTTADIRARFPDAVEIEEGHFVIGTRDPEVGETLLGQFGSGLRSISFERSSLEGVFLNLTGRDMRDRVSGGAGEIEGRRPGQEPRM